MKKLSIGPYIIYDPPKTPDPTNPLITFMCVEEHKPYDQKKQILLALGEKDIKNLISCLQNYLRKEK